jgi:hypothetical protein
MIRDSTAPSSTYAFLGYSPRFGGMVQSRDSPPLFVAGDASAAGTASAAGNVSAAAAPDRWVRLERRGSIVRALGSPDGTTWQTWGSFEIVLGQTILAGFAVASGSRTDLTSATFDNIRAEEDPTPFVRTPSAQQLADPWRTSLSASAENGGAEASLTYTWSVVSAPPGVPLAGAAQFSTNGTNAARNVTATFSAFGNYILRVRATDPQGRSGWADVSVAVPHKPTAIILSPPGKVVPTNSSQQYSAVVLDEFRRPISGYRVAWSATYGRVISNGMYVAPPRSTWDRVTATAGTVRASIDVYSYAIPDGPALVWAASRKVNGRGIVSALPLTIFGAPPTVEARRGGPTTLRFTFGSDVFAPDGTLDANDFDLSGAEFRSATILLADLVLELGGIEDDTVVSVGFGRLVDRTGKPVQGMKHVEVAARFGDVDGSGRVTAADLVILRKAALHRSVQGLIYDLDLSGVVSAADLGLARRRLAATHG